MRISIYIDRLPKELIDEFINWCIFEWAKPVISQLLTKASLASLAIQFQQAITLEQMIVISSSMEQTIYTLLDPYFSMELNQLKNTFIGEEKDRLLILHRSVERVKDAVYIAMNLTDITADIGDIVLNCGVAAIEERIDIDTKYEAKLQQLCKKYNVDVNKTTSM
jgi:hypothetical protein